MIHPSLLNTPQLRYGSLSKALGCSLTLKNETANALGCFKGRGTEFFLGRTHSRLASKALVCASAGNFGLALAFSAARRKLDLTVFVPESANITKIDAIRRHGARIVAKGCDFDEAKDAARVLARSQDARFVEDGAEAEISEGAGTIAVELLTADQYASIVVPLGNGALLAGVGRWVKAQSPHTKVIGVCSVHAPVMRDSWINQSAVPARVSTVATIADGIAVRVPVPEAVADLHTLVDEVRMVDDAQLIDAMRLLRSHTGFMCEPSAVAGVAAIAADCTRFAGERVATILTGRNLTTAQLDRWF